MELAEDVVVMTVTNLMNKKQFLAIFVNIWRFDRKSPIWEENLEDSDESDE